MIEIDQVKKKIKTPNRYSNPFGDYCVLDIPKDCNVVILAVTDRHGLKPVGFYLPGQIYVEIIQKLLIDYNARNIVAIPASSKNYINIIGEF